MSFSEWFEFVKDLELIVGRRAAVFFQNQQKEDSETCDCATLRHPQSSSQKTPQANSYTKTPRKHSTSKASAICFRAQHPPRQLKKNIDIAIMVPCSAWDKNPQEFDKSSDTALVNKRCSARRQEKNLTKSCLRESEVFSLYEGDMVKRS